MVGSRPERRTPGACAASALALALGLGCGSSSQETSARELPPVPVQVVTAEASPLPQTLAAVGTLQSPETTTVAAEIEGVVTSLDVPEGHAVEAGHLLARIDDAQARASLTVARARRQNAKLRLERLGSLRDAAVSSQQAHDDALAEFDAAEGQLEEVETRLRKTYVRAPFAGLLGLRQANLGQYLARGDPIVQITQIDTLDLVFSISERHAARVREGQTVLGVVGQCGEHFEGRVDAVEPRVDPATRMLRVQAVVPNSDVTLRPGMSARVRLVTGEIPDAIVVPQAALIRQGTRHLVYVVDAEGLAHQQKVAVGDYFVAGVHLQTGVSPGERVVVAGHQKLRPGSPTAPSDWQDVDNPNLGLGWYGPGVECGP